MSSSTVQAKRAGQYFSFAIAANTSSIAEMVLFPFSTLLLIPPSTRIENKLIDPATYPIRYNINRTAPFTVQRT